MEKKSTTASGKFKWQVSSRCTFGLVALFFLVGCDTKSGQAIVLTKEHIAAAAPVSETPVPDNAPESMEERPLRDDEITVDSYVMKREVRGTSLDPRAFKEEQWLVKVQLISDSRTFNVPSDQAQFDKLKEGDRVQVRYHVGKYTGTVWGAEIVDARK